jgi:hypothetical protein
VVVDRSQTVGSPRHGVSVISGGDGDPPEEPA